MPAFISSFSWRSTALRCNDCSPIQEAEFEESLRKDREKEKAKGEADAIEAGRMAEIAQKEQFTIQRELSAATKVPAEPDAADKVPLSTSRDSVNATACLANRYSHVCGAPFGRVAGRAQDPVSVAGWGEMRAAIQRN